MRIQECEFPEDVWYDADGFVWLRREPSGDVVLGITSIQAALAGRLTKIQPRAVGTEYARGRSLGTIEGGRYFGAVRTPVRGMLLQVNEAVLSTPKVLSERPYAEGWFAHLRPTAWEEDVASLVPADRARDLLASQIAALHVHCFAAFPDYEMFEIGTECSAVLTKLDETLVHAEAGEVLHLVSDDWTAPAELENWAQRTHNTVLESRKEGNLYHFLIRKVA